MSEIEKAIQYVREHKYWAEWKDDEALDCINKHFPIPCDLCNQIHDLMEEYSGENDLPEGWWLYEMDEEDIFLAL